MKVRLKMTLCMLGLLAVLFGAGGSLLITLSFHTALEREREAACNAYQMVLGTLQIVSGVSGGMDDSDMSLTLEQITAQNAGNWTGLRLYTENRTIYGRNAAALSPAQPPASGQGTIRYASAGPGVHELILSGALTAGRETLYLDMAWNISPLFETRRVEQLTYQRVFLLMAGLCALLSYSLSRVLTAPLVSLSQASRAIAAGQLSSRANIRSRDEIGLVARDFNAMADALEQTIFQLRDAAERQERFTGSFAHEVKTPMTSIIGYADLIRGQTLSAEEQTQAANYIVSEGKRLENLAQKLLDILVLQQGDLVLTPVRPAALIQGLVHHLEPVYRAQGIALTCACQEGACLLDPDLVKSLLVNLWDNARKSMDGRRGRIHVTSQMCPGGCRITVQDNGRGIPPSALKHLTEAFYRVDKSRARAQGGVGLGLSLCREIAALHHGSIQFESKLGEGTTVCVALKGGSA